MSQVKLNSRLPLILLLLSTISCKPGKKLDDNFYDRFFANKIDIKKLALDSLKKENITSFSIVSATVQSDVYTGLAKPGNENEFDYFFITGNLKSKSLKVISNPFKKLSYRSVSFANAEGKIYATSFTHPETLYKYDYIKGALDSFDLSKFKIADPGSLLVSKDKLFFYGTPYGCLIADLTSGNSIDLRNQGIAVTSFHYSTIAVPFTDSLNILSGTKAGNDILLSCVDSLLAKKCEFKIPEVSQIPNFKIASYNNGYLIMNGSQLAFIDKTNHDFKWYKKIDDMQDLIKLSNSNALVISDKDMNGKKTTFLYMVNITTGENKWSVDVGSSYFIDKNIGMADKDVIIVRNNNNILGVNMQNGNIIQSYPHNNQESLSFDVMTDFITGINYYYTNRGIIYWKNQRQ
jgi:outer membrane protein assembly factor BamB